MIALPATFSVTGQSKGTYMDGIRKKHCRMPFVRHIALACAVILISTVLLPAAADAGEVDLLAGLA